MKKSELVSMLNLIDDDLEVIISSDAEGNDFRVIDEISIEDEEDTELFDTMGEVIIIWPV
jgi:hypothetical protein